MNDAQTEVLLLRWGRWAIKSASCALGYGSVSPMFRNAGSVRTGRCADDPGTAPPDVVACDAAVRGLPLVLRCIVIEHYQRQSSIRRTAAACGISHKSASQYLDRARGLVSAALFENKVSNAA